MIYAAPNQLPDQIFYHFHIYISSLRYWILFFISGNRKDKTFLWQEHWLSV